MGSNADLAVGHEMIVMMSVLEEHEDVNRQLHVCPLTARDDWQSCTAGGGASKIRQDFFLQSARMLTDKAEVLLHSTNEPDRKLLFRCETEVPFCGVGRCRYLILMSMDTDWVRVIDRRIALFT